MNKLTDIEGYKELEELALDLHWPWSHRANQIWRHLDSDLWELSHNPWAVLQTVSKEKLSQAFNEPEFKMYLDKLIQRKKLQNQSQTWFQKEHANDALTRVVYFSMEYMLSEALPIYSGGLGNVAGDQLKAASDLGVPVVAIGLLYQQGYFRQVIDSNGNQQALYPYNDPGQLPITPLRKKDGEWLRIQVKFPGWSIWIRTWKVIVGRTTLYLLDSNDIANFPAYRAITSELYGGGPELRLQQEMLLGIAGWRLLEELEIQPEVCHLNEGHAAFAILERANNFMKKNGISFHEALEVTRAGNLFTTHTAVPAGFDRFSPTLIEKYLSRYAGQLGLSIKDFLALGRKNPDDDQEPFNMAYLALNGSGAVNGVSQLHGEVSRKIFEPLFPRWPHQEIPIGYVTNGIHVPSWDSASADEIWTRMAGEERWNWAIGFQEKNISKISDADLWKMRSEARKSLIEYTRVRLARQMAARGAPLSEIESSKNLFDENTLTLGFARRFATYKRPNMLLHDPERLLHLLTNPRFPVQLLIAGKAHPADKPGQALIQQWMHFIENMPEARAHVVFLSDYDMHLTEKLVQGVDVWINTPRRPWEACGTSGMKVLANGGLNVSELDGWWVEAYRSEVGWAIGDGKERGEDLTWDATEALQLYDILEKEIIPTFYNRNSEGVSPRWVEKMRASMAYLTPRFSANRAVRDYTEKYYLPNAKRYLTRAQDKGKMGKAIVDWKKKLAPIWEKLRVGEIKIELKGKNYEVEAFVYLDSLDPQSISVEIFSDGGPNTGMVQKRMSLKGPTVGEPHLYLYQATVLADRPTSAFTARVVPYFPEVAIPLEESRILWQK